MCAMHAQLARPLEQPRQQLLELMYQKGIHALQEQVQSKQGRCWSSRKAMQYGLPQGSQKCDIVRETCNMQYAVKLIRVTVKCIATQQLLSPLPKLMQDLDKLYVLLYESLPARSIADSV